MGDQARRNPEKKNRTERKEIMKYSIEINAEDVTFIVEAIKLRAFCLADDIEKQAKNIKQAHEEMDNERIANMPTPSDVVRDAINFGVVQPKRRRGRPRLDELPF